MTINKNTDLCQVAQVITSNSELFCDEVDTVISQLSSLVRDAETYGCSFTRLVADGWGGSIEVTAVPLCSKSCWVF